MSPERLNILYVSQMPASPPRFGAQARIHGLMTQLARRHDLTAAILVDDEFDADECRRAMQAYCREVVMVPNPCSRQGLAKRLLQVRSLASTRSFERLRVTLPQLQQTLDRVLRAKRFDVVNLEFPYLGHYDLRQAPPGKEPPALVVDSHEIAYDLARQFARAAAAWAVAFMRRPTGASCGGRSWGPIATPTASMCAARRMSGACSTRRPACARRSFPTPQTSTTTSRAPRIPGPTAEPWSISGSSPPSPILMA